MGAVGRLLTRVTAVGRLSASVGAVGQLLASVGAVGRLWRCGHRAIYLRQMHAQIAKSNMAGDGGCGGGGWGVEG